MHTIDFTSSPFFNLATGLCFLSLAILLILIRTIHINSRRKTDLPPGPPGDPILGHIRHIPLSYSWLLFSEWCKAYGEIVYVHILGKPMIILNSFATARELMEKRGRNYSDRPTAVTHGELMGWGDTLPFLQYGEVHRKQRSLIQTSLTPQAVAVYHPLIQSRVEDLLTKLRSSPTQFRKMVYVCIAKIVIRVSYGYDFDSDTDPKMMLAEKANSMSMEAGNVGATLADFIPILKYIPAWLPGAGFKRHALEGSMWRQRVMDDFYDYAWKSYQEGTAKESMLSQMLDKCGNEVQSDPELKHRIKTAAGVMYAAGVDTTYSTISTFFLMMAIYPHFAKRAQQEIEAVTGGMRLPSYDDRANLPYVDCIIKELWRWNPPIPMGVYHLSRDEDTYNGMKIPAKSTIVPNMWQILRDEDFYPDPLTFNPDRFLPLMKDVNSSGMDPEPLANAGDPKSVVFGFGRRICPGLHLADATIWLSIACVLASSDILPPLDPKTGKVVVPYDKFVSGFTVHPAEFMCRVIPRAVSHGQDISF